MHHDHLTVSKHFALLYSACHTTLLIQHFESRAQYTFVLIGGGGGGVDDTR